MASILLVDDATFMKLIEKDILQRAGHDIVGEASNGKEAIERFVELRPDLVIMDINMPDFNGIQALKQIMKINRNARVIMVSALGEPRFIKNAIELGAADFVVKPFKKERILEAIDSALNGH